jgi:predicted nucleic acid-binding protein
VAKIDKVFIDTSELFPFTIMDLLLTLAEQFVFTWVWTEELLDEWERVIVDTTHRTPDSAKSVTNAVRAHFESGLIKVDTYVNDISDDLSPDPGDRAHVAACLGGRATVLLTRNLKDFATPALAESGVRVLTADDYLVDLLRRRPRAVVDGVRQAAAARKYPPISAAELLDRIEHAGAPRFAAALRRRREFVAR